MSTLLDNSSQPLWVWGVVITVGSLFIIGAIAWLVRYWILFRRTRSDIEFISDEPAEKKVTLRRGRVVPATSYLSLTGSRFGIGSYGTEDGRETPSMRSKSPFEWWANLRNRSSRLSYVSHVSSTQYPSSPRTPSFYQRPDTSTSKLSLTSKEEGLRATVVEVKVTKPQPTLHVPSFKRSSRSFEPVNFSRSFTSQAYRPSAPHHIKTLSRISEITPRQSMFSTASLKVRKGSVSTSEHSQNSDQQVANRLSSGTLLKVPAWVSHSRQQSASSSREVLQQYEYEHDNPLGSNPSSPYLPLVPTTQSFPEPIVEAMPAPVPQHGLWESSMKQFPWLDHQYQQQSHPADFLPSQGISADVCYTQPQLYTQRQSSQSIRAEGEEIQYRPSSIQLQSQSQIPSQPQIPSGPLRTRSKKGNVLRKKSLERTKVLSMYR